MAVLKRIGRWLRTAAIITVFSPLMIVMGMLMYGVLKELTLWLVSRLTF